MEMINLYKELEDFYLETSMANTAARELGVDDPDGKKAYGFIKYEKLIIENIKLLSEKITTLALLSGEEWAIKESECVREKANKTIENVKWAIDLHLGR